MTNEIIEALKDEKAVLTRKKQVLIGLEPTYENSISMIKTLAKLEFIEYLFAEIQERI